MLNGMFFSDRYFVVFQGVSAFLSTQRLKLFAAIEKKTPQTEYVLLRLRLLIFTAAATAAAAPTSVLCFGIPGTRRMVHIVRSSVQYECRAYCCLYAVCKHDHCRICLELCGLWFADLGMRLVLCVDHACGVCWLRKSRQVFIGKPMIVA